MGPEVAQHRIVIDTFIQVPSHISASSLWFLFPCSRDAIG
jgi:hypothetical protein